MKWHGVSIYTGDKFKFTNPQIYTNGAWKQGQPYVYTDGQWKLIGAACTQMIEFVESGGKYVETSTLNFNGTLNGTTWIFNDNPSAPDDDFSLGRFINDNFIPCFTSNNSNFAIMMMYPNGGITYYDSNFNDTYAYNSGWTSASIKTITFIAEPNDFSPDQTSVLAWLQANATLSDGGSNGNIPFLVREPYPQSSSSIGSTQLTDNTDAELVDAGANILTY